jgi:hypothetical protein
MSIQKGKTPPKKKNSSKNRYYATSANSKAVFERTSHKKEYRRWSIINVYSYELVGELKRKVQY